MFNIWSLTTMKILHIAWKLSKSIKKIDTHTDAEVYLTEMPTSFVIYLGNFNYKTN